MNIKINTMLTEAVSAHAAGKLEDAERLYQGILSENMENPDASHKIGVLAVNCEKIDIAPLLITAAANSNPNNPQFWATCIEALIIARNLSIATELFWTLHQMDHRDFKFDRIKQELLTQCGYPKDLPPALMCAMVKKESASYGDSIKIIKEYLEHNRDDYTALSILSENYLRNNQDELAWDALNRASHLDKNASIVKRSLARLLLKKKMLTEALHEASSAFYSDMADPENCIVFAAVLSANGQSDRAFELVDHALGIEPRYSDAFRIRAAIKLGNQDTVGAITDLEFAVSIKPHAFDVWVMLASARYNTNDFHGAIVALESALMLQPLSVDQLVNLAALRHRVGDTIAEIELLRRALSVAPLRSNLWCSLGSALETASRWDEARLAYLQAKEISPDNLQIHSYIVDLEIKQEKWSAALDCIEQILAVNPTNVEMLNKKSMVLIKLGQPEDAIENYKVTIQTNPSSAETHFNLGITQQLLGRSSEAVESYKEAIRLKPDFTDAFFNLGVVFGFLGRLSDAEAQYRQVIRLSPNFFQAYSNLGNTLFELSRFREAEESCLHAIRLNSKYPEAYNNLGNSQRALGSLPEARASYEMAIQIKPDFAEAYNNLGNVHLDLDRYPDAAECYRHAINLKRDYAQAHSNLGNALRRMMRLVEAEASYKEAIRLKPAFIQAYVNLGSVKKDLGDFSGAEESYRWAIRLNPELIDTYHNLLFLVNYDHRRSPGEVFEEYQAFGNFISIRYPKKYNHNAQEVSARRRIRIGYSSPDFKGHACRFFIEPLFRHHDHEKFEFFAYSNVKVPDVHTERIKQYFDHWVDVFALSDQEMAARVHADGIDILIDLAGHTNGNRLPVFALKPAPIQVTYPAGTGYTSGLKEIDYFFGSEHLTPDGCAEYYSERVWRLPGPLACYDPSYESFPGVNELPLLRNGFVTFGSLARPVRINDGLLLTWKEIMNRVPDSRLRLDQKVFADSPSQKIFLNRMESLGMPIERVDLVNSQPHWFGYHEIDISLDCFPHNAGTTTLESLWMGVPVLTKTDLLSISRIGSSILSPLGLGEWVAEDKDTYIEKAVGFSKDIEKLITLRKSLRPRLEQSVFMKYQLLTDQIEQAFINMRKRYLEKSLSV